MQFRAYRIPRIGLALDLQSDLMDTPARVSALLVPVPGSLPVLTALEPLLTVEGTPHILRMSQIFTIPRRLLSGSPVADLSSEDYAIRRALDMLFSGF